MIGILMQVRAKADQADQFAQLIATLQRDVRTHEPGVLLFHVMRGAEDPTLFVFTEVFADEAAYAAHPGMPYHKAMSAAGWACVDGEPDIRRFVSLSDNDIVGGRA